MKLQAGSKIITLAALGFTLTAAGTFYALLHAERTIEANYHQTITHTLTAVGADLSHYVQRINSDYYDLINASLNNILALDQSFYHKDPLLSFFDHNIRTASAYSSGENLAYALESLNYYHIPYFSYDFNTKELQGHMGIADEAKAKEAQESLLHARTQDGTTLQELIAAPPSLKQSFTILYSGSDTYLCLRLYDEQTHSNYYVVNSYLKVLDNIALNIKNVFSDLDPMLHGILKDDAVMIVRRGHPILKTKDFDLSLDTSSKSLRQLVGVRVIDPQGAAISDVSSITQEHQASILAVSYLRSINSYLVIKRPFTDLKPDTSQLLYTRIGVILLSLLCFGALVRAVLKDNESDIEQENDLEHVVHKLQALGPEEFKQRLQQVHDEIAATQQKMAEEPTAVNTASSPEAPTAPADAEASTTHGNAQPVAQTAEQESFTPQQSDDGTATAATAKKQDAASDSDSDSTSAPAAAASSEANSAATQDQDAAADSKSTDDQTASAEHDAAASSANSDATPSGDSSVTSEQVPAASSTSESASSSSSSSSSEQQDKATATATDTATDTAESGAAIAPEEANATTAHSTSAKTPSTGAHPEEQHASAKTELSSEQHSEPAHNTEANLEASDADNNAVTVAPELVSERFVREFLQGENLPENSPEGQMVAAALRLATELNSSFNEQLNELRQEFKARIPVYRKEGQCIAARQMLLSALPSEEAMPSSNFVDFAAFTVPARDLSGNFYNIQRLDEDNLAFVIGDCSSSGTKAAYTVAVVSILVSEALKLDLDPPHVMQYLNERLCEIPHLTPVALFIGMISEKTGNVIAANAGHCVPIVIDNTGPHFVAPFNEQRLGVNKEQEFDLIKWYLANDDMVLLYSNGILNVKNSAGEIFGMDRLLDHCVGANELRADELIIKILNDIKLHKGKRPFREDVSLICLKQLLIRF